MRVFVSEFLVGGASIGSNASPSMRREGLAMLQAVTEDLARLPNVRVVTTLEANLPSSLVGDVIRVDSTEHEQAVFQQLLSETDAVLVIAPETDGILAGRCRQVCNADVESWNCSPSSIELCGDKLKLAEHLQSSGLRTIPTQLLDFSLPFDEQIFPRVFKPRDGAGSACTFLVRNQADYEQAARTFREQGIADKCLVQPLIQGQSLSVAVMISLDGRRRECLPVAEQRLSNDGRFCYLGGKIPADIPSSVCQAMEHLAMSACRTVQGLRGYVGVDMVLPIEGPPVIVEINPRLTTSYVGYRQLYSEPLPALWMSSTNQPGRTEISTIEFET